MFMKEYIAMWREGDKAILRPVMLKSCNTVEVKMDVDTLRSHLLSILQILEELEGNARKS